MSLSKTSKSLIDLSKLVALKNSSNLIKSYKKVDPRDRYVFIFPDYHFVRVGVGFNLINNHEAERVYLRASEILNKSLLKLCLGGPKEELCNSFVNKSIAAFITSKAAVAKLFSEKPEILPLTSAAAGIGVGQFNNLDFCDVMTFEDAFDLVIKRAEAVERAAQIVPSLSIRVKLRPATSLVKVCLAAKNHCLRNGIPEDIAVCSVSSKLTWNTVVISGHQIALEYLEQEGPRLFEFRHVTRILTDPPSYHTMLMAPVKEYLKLYTEQKCKENPNYIKEPRKAFFCATTGKRLHKLEDFRRVIYEEIVSPSKIEPLLTDLFKRSKDIAQPNVYIVASKTLMSNLKLVHGKAFRSSKLLNV